MDTPGLKDVLEARNTIAPYVSRTPLIPYPALSAYLGADIRRERHCGCAGGRQPR